MAISTRLQIEVDLHKAMRVEIAMCNFDFQFGGWANNIFFHSKLQSLQKKL